MPEQIKARTSTRRPVLDIGVLRPASVSDVLALGILALVLLATAAPGVLTPYDPLAPDPDATLQALSFAHPFGTDYMGRDLLARIIYGARQTIEGSLLAVLIGLLSGMLLGLLAAYLGRIVDVVIGRLVDVLLSIPGLLLSMVIVVSLGFGTVHAAIAVGISSVAVFTRLMRSEVLTVKQLAYVEASRHSGQRPLGVLLCHVLPNAYASVLSLAALQFGSAILWISSLSFLGYGAAPPQPEWGLLVAEGRDYIVSSPWMVLLPGATVVVTVLAISHASHMISRRSA